MDTRFLTGMIFSGKCIFCSFPSCCLILLFSKNDFPPCIRSDNDTLFFDNTGQCIEEWNGRFFCTRSCCIHFARQTEGGQDERNWDRDKKNVVDSQTEKTEYPALGILVEDLCTFLDVPDIFNSVQDIRIIL